MAVTFNRTDYAGHFPEIWRGDCKILPGGFKPVQEYPVGTVVRRGVPIYVDFDNMTAAICKTATVVNGGTTTKVRIAKGHYFQAGDVVAKYGDASASTTIKSIDTSNADYDVIELAKGISLAADDVVFESTEVTEENTKATPAHEPNFVIGSEKHFDGKGLPTFDAAYDAVVLIPSLAAPMLDEWKQGVALKNNPNIIYIKQ
jgi:hypothetical protein